MVPASIPDRDCHRLHIPAVTIQGIAAAMRSESGGCVSVDEFYELLDNSAVKDDSEGADPSSLQEDAKKVRHTADRKNAFRVRQCPVGYAAK